MRIEYFKSNFINAAVVLKLRIIAELIVKK